MVADVIAAPHDHVATDFYKGLNRIVFEDKTIVAYRLAPVRALRAYISDQLITCALRLRINFGAHVVHILVTHRHKHFEIIRRMAAC